MTEKDTPIPESRAEKENGSRLPRLTWKMVWSALIGVGLLVAGFTTKYVYATKAELSEYAVRQAQVAADLVMQTALNQKAVDNAVNAQKDIKDDVKDIAEAVQIIDINVRTFMIEQDVERRKIAKPPARDR